MGEVEAQAVGVKATERADGSISLAEARLLRDLRGGKAAAAHEVWERFRSPIQAVCRGMGDGSGETVVEWRALFDGLRAGFQETARHWPVDRPLCCLVGAWVFTALAGRLNVGSLVGVQVSIPRVVRAPSIDEVPERLGRLSPAVRLVYLVDLYFGCPASLLAEISGQPEVGLRMARAVGAWGMVDAGSQT